MRTAKFQINTCYRRFTGLAIFICCSFLPALPTAKEIVVSADDARSPQGSFSFQVTVEDWENGQVSSKTGYKIFSKNQDLTRIETISPERLSGRKLLMHQNDLWLYLPSIKRPTRVSFQQRLTGEVANGDLARTLLARDYDATLLGEESINGKLNYKLSLKASNKEATYRNIAYWVEKSTLYPTKMECYALSGKLLKTAEFSSPVQSLGKPRMSKIAIADALTPSKKSLLNYFNYKLEKLDESFFSKENLTD